jgi:AGCS family alanine or glycine:cation symporter
MLERISIFLWGPWTAAVMVGVGVYFIAGTGFMPFRRMRHVWRATLGSLLGTARADTGSAPTRSKPVTPFQSLTTALAGTIGTGNLAGVAIALSIGGPGAVFWLWVSALCGMMTKYAEIVLAMHYRHQAGSGEQIGGPMYYLRHGLGSNRLGKLYAALCLVAALGVGSSVQAGTMASSLTGMVPDTRWVGLFAAVAVGLVVFGGIKRLASLTEFVMPLFSCLYVAAALVVVILHAGALPGVFAEIFRGAFQGTSMAGGFAGATAMAALRTGMAKGVFSHEAGLGTAAMAHALSDAKHPAQQGMWGIVEVFIDTMVVCTATALVLLTTGVWAQPAAGAGVRDGAAMTVQAFSSALHSWAGPAVALITVVFAFASILSWSLYGRRCVEFLAGSRKFTPLFYAAFLASTAMGAVVSPRIVWQLADIADVLLAVPNLIGLVLLSGVVFKLTKAYFGNS